MGLVRLILSIIPVDEELLHMFLRKTVHVVIFAVLTLLLRLTLYYGPQLARSRWVMLFPVLWAFLDEATKPLVEGRHFSVLDTGLNWLGDIEYFAFLVDATRVHAPEEAGESTERGECDPMDELAMRMQYAISHGGYGLDDEEIESEQQRAVEKFV